MMDDVTGDPDPSASSRPTALHSGNAPGGFAVSAPEVYVVADHQDRSSARISGCPQNIGYTWLYHPRKSPNPMVDDDVRYQHWYFSTKIFRCLKKNSAVLLQLSSVENSARCYCVRGNRRTHSPALSKSLYQWTFRFSGGFWDRKSSILFFFGVIIKFIMVANFDTIIPNH